MAIRSRPSLPHHSYKWGGLGSPPKYSSNVCGLASMPLLERKCIKSCWLPDWKGWVLLTALCRPGFVWWPVGPALPHCQVSQWPLGVSRPGEVAACWRMAGSRFSDFSAPNWLRGFGGSFVRMSYLYHSRTAVQFTDFYMLNTNHWLSIYASYLLEGICFTLTLPTELKRRGAVEVNPALSLQSHQPQCPSRCLLHLGSHSVGEREKMLKGHMSCR